MDRDQQSNYDPKTGLKERTLDLQSMMGHQSALQKPRGKDLFKRIAPTVDYV